MVCILYIWFIFKLYTTILVILNNLRDAKYCFKILLKNKLYFLIVSFYNFVANIKVDLIKFYNFYTHFST
jgi:hypothetical protein